MLLDFCQIIEIPRRKEGNEEKKGRKREKEGKREGGSFKLRRKNIAQTSKSTGEYFKNKFER